MLVCDIATAVLPCTICLQSPCKQLWALTHPQQSRVCLSVVYPCLSAVLTMSWTLSMQNPGPLPAALGIGAQQQLMCCKATCPQLCILGLQSAEPLQAALGSEALQQFDVCIANILRGPLLDLQPRLCAYLKPAGTLLLSGILDSQVSFPALPMCVWAWPTFRGALH